MKKKGFTLVELLAVIAILAILVIMALPAVLRMYRQSRINNFQNEVRGVYKSAQQQFVSDSINLESGQKILYTNATSCNPTGVDVVKQLDMTGNTDFKYYVLMNVDGKVLNVRATNGTYSYSLQAEDKKHDIKVEDIEVETNNQETIDSDIDSTLCLIEENNYVSHISTEVSGQTCSKTDVGCELIIGGENFYVVSSDEDKTILLTKYDLKSDGSGSYTQDTSGTNTNIVKANFLNSSKIAYWDSKNCEYKYNYDWSCPSSNPSGLISPYSDNEKTYCTSLSSVIANCAYVYDENAINIYSVVNAYANKISSIADIIVSGRLIMLEEVVELDSNIRKDKNNYYYWLGSAVGEGGVWCVTYEAGIISNIYTTRVFYTYGIRPVIIVPTSAL